MTVELWYGRWPENAGEQEVLIELYSLFLSQTDHFLMMVNFAARQTNEVDLVIVKEQGLFIAELKHCRAKIIGKKEGAWQAFPPGEAPFTLYPVRSNPFKQVSYNWWHFRDWLEQHQAEISAGVARPAPVDYGALKSFVVIAPDLYPESQIDIGDGPVHVLGLPRFETDMLMRTSPRVGLSRQEMRRIPQLLSLTEWRVRPPALVDPNQTVPLEPPYKAASFVILVARGHDLSVPVFKLSSLAKEVITVGRDPDNDLVIDHPAMSRHHAEIRQVAGRYVVRDLHSDNGTFICYAGDPSEERRLGGGVENALKNHSVIRFGPASYTLLMDQ